MADKVINIGNSDNKVTVNVTDKIVCPTFEGTATKVGHKLSFGNKTFDGSSTVILSGTDLGSVDLTSELTIIGLKTFSGETYLDSLNANTGLISGNLRVINGIFGNLTGNVIGNLSGNASTASKLQTARTLTIGNTGKSFDGSSNVSWTLSEIGAASSSHTHNYLPLSGGTVTGQLYLTGLEEGTADVTDNTELLTSFASNNGFSETNAIGKIYKRDAIHIYNYIKNKLDSVYSAIGHTHSYLPLSGGTITGTLNINRDLAAIQYNNSKGVSQGWLGFSAVDTPTVWMANGSTRYNIIHSGNIGSQSVNYATTAGSIPNIKTFTFNAGREYIGWVSIAKLKLNDSNQYDYHSFDLYICRSYNSSSSESYACNVAIGWKEASIKLINKSIRTQIINKVRIAIDSTNHYLYLLVYVDTQYSTTRNNCSAVLSGIFYRSWESDNTVNDSVSEVAVCNLTAGTYSDSAGNAGTATNVAWSGVTNKPNFVNSFGTKTGDITVRGGQTGNGSVNLVMSNNELLASIVGLGSNAYTSTAYLPLSGGTMTGPTIYNYTLNNNARYTWRNSRQVENGGERADNFIRLEKADGSFNASFGIKGTNEIDEYMYIGYDNSFKGLNLRIGPSSLTWGDNTIYHTGNLSPMTTSHPANSITKTNIDNWNAVHTWYTTATADDTTNTIDTWKEIEAFVSSFKKGDNLATYLANNYLAKSGGTVTSTNFAPFIIERSGSTNAAAILFKNSNGSLGYIGMASSANRGLVRWTSNFNTKYIILDSSNSSVSLSGSTLSVKINGTTKSLTNTDSNVAQVVTSSNNTDYRPVILGASSNDSTNSFSNTTSSVYAAANVYIKPDNGNLYTKGSLNASTTISSGTSVSAGTTVTAATSVTSIAGDFYVGGTSGSRCHIKMDTTNKCIKFIFD